MNSMLEKEIYECEIVAFDIFDTVLLRDISPDKIINLWAQELISYYKLKLSVEKVIYIRLWLGRWGKFENFLSGNGRECSYAQLCDLIKRVTGIEDIYFASVSGEIECQLEREHTCVNPEIMKQLLWCEKQRKNMICISDFYLPEIYIKKIFTYHNIDKYFDKYFISADYKKRKKEGDLYTEIIKRYADTEPYKILMIGDNYNSDYSNALKAGLRAHHYFKN